jgi:hypothetical protein
MWHGGAGMCAGPRGSKPLKRLQALLVVNTPMNRGC